MKYLKNQIFKNSDLQKKAELKAKQ